MTENASSINDRVFVIISEQLGVQKETLTLTSSFAEDLGADSLDTIELIMRFEEEFGVRIPDEHSSLCFFAFCWVRSFLF